jgi:hypothetical protein
MGLAGKRSGRSMNGGLVTVASRFHPFASPNDAVRFEWVAGFGRCLEVPTIRGALLQNERMTRVAVDLWLVLQ